ncbi:MAG: hypothetical protein ACJA00_003552 [Myxococcota bacterium]|jgi:hypothetical protein
MAWQARVLDAQGEPISGAHTVDIALYGSQAGSEVRWSDPFDLQLTDGYVSIRLATGIEVVDNDLFATGDLWIEVRDADASVALGVRQPLSHIPVAAVSKGIRAERATGVSDGIDGRNRREGAFRAAAN